MNSVPTYIDFLNSPDMADIALTPAGIIGAVKSGRESDDRTILFWHRGLSLSDIALGHAMLAKAKRLGMGQRLRLS